MLILIPAPLIHPTFWFALNIPCPVYVIQFPVGGDIVFRVQQIYFYVCTKYPWRDKLPK